MENLSFSFLILFGYLKLDLPPAPAPLLSTFCFLASAHCFRFRLSYEQGFGNTGESLEFVGCNLHSRGKHAANSLRQEFGGEDCCGADEFYNIASTAPMFANNLWIGPFHQPKQRQRDEVSIVNLPHKRDHVRYQIKRDDGVDDRSRK
jgi:hypothetical protein